LAARPQTCDRAASVLPARETTRVTNAQRREYRRRSLPDRLPSALLRACWPSSLCWHYLCYARTLARRSCPRRLTGTRHSCDSCVKIARRTAGAQSTSEWLPIDAQWPEASLRPTMPAMIKARPLRRNGSAGSPKAAMPTIPVPAAAKIMPNSGQANPACFSTSSCISDKTKPKLSMISKDDVHLGLHPPAASPAEPLPKIAASEGQPTTRCRYARPGQRKSGQHHEDRVASDLIVGLEFSGE